MGCSGLPLLILVLLLTLLFGCTPRDGGQEASVPELSPGRETSNGGGAPIDVSAEVDSRLPGRGDREEGDRDAASPAIEDASSIIVYPDGALRRIYPEDYRLGRVVTAETREPAVDLARRFLDAVVTGEVPRDLILEESRFVVLETIGQDGWPGIDGFRLGEPISTGDGVIALPVVLFSGGRLGITEVYIEHHDDVWYISEFPVFPGMFDRDEGAIRPQGLFDPRSPQL
ncbi:MAG: hypothetical protein ACOCW6_09140 [Spirochaetota bacterium]